MSVVQRKIGKQTFAVYVEVSNELDALAARLAEALRVLDTIDDEGDDHYYGIADHARMILRGTADSADAVTCDHFPGQTVCHWCKGTGAIDAPTSADDPSCPDCDGEGNIAVCEHCGSADAFDGMWHKLDCPTLNHPVQKPYPPMTGSGDGEGNAPKNSR